jgi:hypothetical protein
LKGTGKDELSETIGILDIKMCECSHRVIFWASVKILVGLVIIYLVPVQ